MQRYFDQNTVGIERRLAGALSRLSTAIRAKTWSGATERGLSPTQGQALAVLLNRGPQRLSSLAPLLGVTAPSASDSVRALVSKKLVTKLPDPDDKRAVRVQLTKAGRKIAQETAEWPDFLVAALDALTEDERRTMLVSIIKMIRTLQVRGDIAPQRMCVGCAHFRPRQKGDSDHYCNLVKAPLRPHQLRLDCPEQTPLPSTEADAVWQAFLTTVQ
ncbi:MAG: MarR family winged helix-turn-helix transcriptional regulator [Myxococcota bacterium]